MKSVRILLCCGVGMSSGFLAKNTRKAAKNKSMAVSVEARSQADAADYFQMIDLLLIGPHYAAQLDEFREMAKPYGVPVFVIPQKIYAELDGESLLEFALNALTENEENE